MNAVLRSPSERMIRSRFESNLVFVSVQQGRRSFNVSLRLGRLPEVGHVMLHEALGMLAPERFSKIRCQATTVAALNQCLEALASAVKEECGDLLEGDDAAYALLRNHAAETREKATIDAEYGAIVYRADRAWEAQDRERAAELYASAEPALDGVRRRRLAYMQRHKR